VRPRLGPAIAESVTHSTAGPSRWTHRVGNERPRVRDRHPHLTRRTSWQPRRRTRGFGRASRRRQLVARLPPPSYVPKARLRHRGRRQAAAPRHIICTACVSAKARTTYSAACRSAGAAALTSASTWTSNLAKFLLNMSTSARACGVVGGLVGPGLARVEDAGLHARQRGRHLEAEQRVGAHRLVLQRARQRRVEQRARRLDRHAPPRRTCRRSSRC
jgi:hypothetical protein